MKQLNRRTGRFSEQSHAASTPRANQAVVTYGASTVSGSFCHWRLVIDD